MSTSRARAQEFREAAGFLLISLAVLATAAVIDRTVVPDIVPIAFAESPQPLWAVELSFLLRSVELLAGSVSLFALAVIIAIAIRNVVTDPARRLTAADHRARL
jgi:hypothetical protein